MCRTKSTTLFLMKKEKGFLRVSLAKGLKRFRGEQSQNLFAKKLGIDSSSLNRIENKVQNVSIDTLEKLCLNLNCSVAELFSDKK